MSRINNNVRANNKTNSQVDSILHYAFLLYLFDPSQFLSQSCLSCVCLCTYLHVIAPSLLLLPTIVLVCCVSAFALIFLLLHLALPCHHYVLLTFVYEIVMITSSLLLLRTIIHVYSCCQLTRVQMPQYLSIQVASRCIYQ